MFESAGSRRLLLLPHIFDCILVFFQSVLFLHISLSLSFIAEHETRSQSYIVPAVPCLVCLVYYTARSQRGSFYAFCIVCSLYSHVSARASNAARRLCS